MDVDEETLDVLDFILNTPVFDDVRERKSCLVY